MYPVSIQRIVPPRRSISSRDSPKYVFRAQSVSDSTKQLPARGSTVWVTLLSKAMTCWVRSASFASRSFGREERSASSRRVRVKRLGPRPRPRPEPEERPARHCSAAAGRSKSSLRSGNGNRSIQLLGSCAPKRSFMIFAQILRAARNFAISSKKSLCTLKKKESCPAN